MHIPKPVGTVLENELGAGTKLNAGGGCYGSLGKEMLLTDCGMEWKKGWDSCAREE